MSVIVIVADSLRTDHIGCYGSTVQTPNIDRLASESILFEQAYAENLYTLPCRTSWWTGKYLFPVRGWQPLEPGDALLPEVLSSRGYASALVTDTYHMHGPTYNYGRGFDTTVFIRGQEYDPWIVDESIPVDPGLLHRLRGDEGDADWKKNFSQYLRNRTTLKTEEDHFTARVIRESIRWLKHTPSGCWRPRATRS
jgi:arylsulfatase A-like enzyme